MELKSNIELEERPTEGIDVRINFQSGCTFFSNIEDFQINKWIFGSFLPLDSTCLFQLTVAQIFISHE